MLQDNSQNKDNFPPQNPLPGDANEFKNRRALRPKDFKFKPAVIWVYFAVILLAWWIRETQVLDIEAVLKYIHSFPVFAPVIFILVYAALVVLLIPTLPVNLAAGIFWGGVWGGILAALGAGLGAMVAFILARIGLGQPLARRYDNRLLMWITDQLKFHPWKTLAFVRLNPAFPTGPVNFLFGLTSVPFSIYAIASVVFFIPPATGVAYIGAQTGEIILSGDSLDLIRVLSLCLLGVIILLVSYWSANALLNNKSIKKALMKVTLLVLTLNEVDGMRVIMPRIDPNWCHQIIILDGGSTDGTIEYAKEKGYFVYVQQQKGFRHAYSEVMEYVEGDVIITFSPDGNSIPELIPDLIEQMKAGYDMVIVSRYKDDAKSEDDDMVTAFGNWLFTKTVNILHRAHYTDVMVIYRAYKTQIVYDLDLLSDSAYDLPEKMFQTKISWEPLLSVRAAKAKLKIGEIPGDEPPRIGGERKLKVLKWGAAYYFQFWRELWFWRYGRKKI